MKKNLLRIATAVSLLCLNNLSFSQTWDSILTGVNKIISNTKYPDCNEILVINNTDILAATLSGVYKSTNNGGSWVKKTIPGPTSSYVGDGYIGVKKVNGSRVIALGMGGTLGNSISKSDDGGNSWAASLTGIIGNAIVEDLSLAPNGNIFIATRVGVSSPKVYLSTDNGDNWTPKNNGLPTNIALWSVLAVNDTVILAGGNNGIYRSTDSGNNWALIHGTGTGYVVCLKKNHAGVIYAGLASGLIRKSTDNGATWATTSLVGNSAMVYDIEFDNNDNIYVCTFLAGIIKYNSSEVVQSAIASSANGMQNLRLNDLAIDESGTTPVLYASCVSSSSVGGSMYRYGFSSDVSVPELNKYASLSLYPNPAQSTLHVSEIKMEDNFSIKLGSIDGRIIRTIQNSNEIEVSDLLPGIYFINVCDSSGNSVTKKFIKE